MAARAIKRSASTRGFAARSRRRLVVKLARAAAAGRCPRRRESSQLRRGREPPTAHVTSRLLRPEMTSRRDLNSCSCGGETETDDGVTPSHVVTSLISLSRGILTAWRSFRFAARVEVNISPAFLHRVRITLHS